MPGSHRNPIHFHPKEVDIVEEFETIPHEQWRNLCEGFSRTHRGWLICLWVVDTGNLEAGLTDATEKAIRDLELGEIIVERHGQRTDMVVIARDDQTHADHIIRGVVAVSVERDTDGRTNGLRIDSDDNKTALVRFRVPANSESLDGLAPGELP
nr:DUF5335 family protein [Sedimenticola hydrogenitrophicus]